MANTIVGKDRADLEAFVAMGDTAVPGIEASDINDGDIIARTSENINPNGTFQFVYKPEDGSDPIVSDWIDQDHKKNVRLQWIEGCKNAIVGRAGAAIAAANALSEETRARSIRAEQLGDTDESEVANTTAVARPRNPSREAVVRTEPDHHDDPTAYVTNQLAVANERLRSAEATQSEILREVLAARQAVAKWQSLNAALTVSEPVVQRPELLSLSKVGVPVDLVLSRGGFAGQVVPYK